MTRDPQRAGLERLESVIAGLREDGWTYRQIAEQAGVSPASVHKLVSGEVKSPSYSTALRIESLAGRIRRG